METLVVVSWRIFNKGPSPLVYLMFIGVPAIVSWCLPQINWKMVDCHTGLPDVSVHAVGEDIHSFRHCPNYLSSSNTKTAAGDTDVPWQALL